MTGSLFAQKQTGIETDINYLFTYTGNNWGFSSGISYIHPVNQRLYIKSGIHFTQFKIKHL